MNNGMHTHTCKKRKYAYIYMRKKKTKHRQHGADEASNCIGSGVLPIIY